MVNGFDFLKENKKDSFKLFIKKIEKIGEKLNNEKINNDAYHTIYKFTDTICNNDSDNNHSTMLHMTTDYSQETSACKQAYVSLHLNKWMLDNRYAVEYDGGTKKAPKSWIKFQKTGSKI